MFRTYCKCKTFTSCILLNVLDVWAKHCIHINNIIVFDVHNIIEYNIVLKVYYIFQGDELFFRTKYIRGR